MERIYAKFTNSIDFVVCFEVIDLLTKDIKYTCLVMSGDKIPENKTEDILEICAIANTVKFSQEGYKAIDIFEVIDSNQNTLWKSELNKE